jgi:hypothetical protein
LDLILGGNHFNFQPQYDRLDGSFVEVFIQRKKMQFELMDPAQSGILLKGQIRDIKKVNSVGKTNYLLLRNNDFPTRYQLN